MVCGVWCVMCGMVSECGEGVDAGLSKANGKCKG